MDTTTGRTTEKNDGSRVRLIGSSMSPVFPLGTAVDIAPCHRPKIGQVALMNAGPHALLHRIVGRFSINRRTWFLHAGDASGLPGLVRSEDIVGIAQPETAYRISSSLRILNAAMNLMGLLASMGLDPRFLFSSRTLCAMFSGVRKHIAPIKI